MVSNSLLRGPLNDDASPPLGLAVWTCARNSVKSEFRSNFLLHRRLAEVELWPPSRLLKPLTGSLHCLTLLDMRRADRLIGDVQGAAGAQKTAKIGHSPL